MRKIFVIQNLITGNYYDSTLREFSSIDKATIYTTALEAEQRVLKFTEGYYLIKPIYTNR